MARYKLQHASTGTSPTTRAGGSRSSATRASPRSARGATAPSLGHYSQPPAHLRATPRGRVLHAGRGARGGRLRRRAARDGGAGDRDAGPRQRRPRRLPGLACTPGPFKVEPNWGVFPDIFCPKEETFTFLEGVLDETMALFPSTYIHIGGDEAPKPRWEASPHRQERMRREGLKDVHELQSYFIRRMDAYLNARGRRLVGWDEILEGGLAPGATVMSWRGIAGGIAARAAGPRRGDDARQPPVLRPLPGPARRGAGDHRRQLDAGEGLRLRADPGRPHRRAGPPHPRRAGATSGPST